MKKAIIWIIAATVISFGLFMGARGAGGEPAATFSQVQSDVAAGAKFYDVRTPEEYAAGRFVGADNWPLQVMQAGQLPNVAKDTKLYIHCQSGNRSAQAATILRQNGYTNVIDLGGLAEVRASGGEMES